MDGNSSNTDITPATCTPLEHIVSKDCNKIDIAKLRLENSNLMEICDTAVTVHDILTKPQRDTQFLTSNNIRDDACNEIYDGISADVINKGSSLNTIETLVHKDIMKNDHNDNVTVEERLPDPQQLKKPGNRDIATAGEMLNESQQQHQLNQCFASKDIKDAIRCDEFVCLQPSYEIIKSESSLNTVEIIADKDNIKNDQKNEEILANQNSQLSLPFTSNNVKDGSIIESESSLNTIENIKIIENKEIVNDGLNAEQCKSKLIVRSEGLDMLANYNSDDCDDDGNVATNEVHIHRKESMTLYRTKTIEIDSDSDDIRSVINFDTDDDNNDDSYFNDKTNRGTMRKSHNIPRVKGELLLDDLPPIEDLQITVPESHCIEFGRIQAIVNQLVLVNVIPNSLLLDLNTILFLKKGQSVLGEVFDVLGQVTDPIYCVRFNSENHIKEKNIHVGDAVYVAPKTPYTQVIVLSNLMRMRGSDASWKNDIEPPYQFLDYSDDESERDARRQLQEKPARCSTKRLRNSHTTIVNQTDG